MYTAVLISADTHSTFLGSGSHSPFPIHIDVLEPVSTNPGGTSESYSTSSHCWLTVVSDDDKISTGFPQLAETNMKT